MNRLKIALAATVLALASLGGITTPAHACAGPACEAINAVCTVAKGYDCVR